MPNSLSPGGTFPGFTWDPGLSAPAFSPPSAPAPNSRLAETLALRALGGAFARPDDANAGLLAIMRGLGAQGGAPMGPTGMRAPSPTPLAPFAPTPEPAFR